MSCGEWDTGSSVFTDDFETFSDDQSLTECDYWDSSLGAHKVVTSPDNAVQSTNATGTSRSYVVNGLGWPDDQYSIITLGTVPGVEGYVGPSIRITSGNAYLCQVSFSALSLFRVNSGSYTYLDMASSGAVVGDTVKLGAVGNVIYVQLNGVTKITYTDSSTDALDSGSPGIYTYTNEGTISAVTVGPFTTPTTSTSTTSTTSSSSSSTTKTSTSSSSSSSSSSISTVTENVCGLWDTAGGTFTDDFESFSDGDNISICDYWSASLNPTFNTMLVNETTDGNIVGHEGFFSGLYYVVKSSWPDDQYSEITIGDLTTGFLGPAVRGSGTSPNTNGYFCMTNSTSVELIRVNNDDSTSLALPVNCSPASGDLLKLGVVGNTLYVKLNGVLILQLTDSDTDAVLSGSPGIFSSGVGDDDATISSVTVGPFSVVTTSSSSTTTASTSSSSSSTTNTSSSSSSTTNTSSSSSSSTFTTVSYLPEYHNLAIRKLGGLAIRGLGNLEIRG